MTTTKTIDRQSGFTLIEMLVAMAITLILIAGTLGLFESATRANEAGTQLANLNQNLRTGMNLVIRDLLQTGQGIPTGGIPIPNGLGILPINRPSPPGQNYTFPPAYLNMPAIVPGAVMGPNNANTLGVPTDMITLFYADATLPLTSPPVGNNPPTSQFVVLAANGSTITVDPANPISGAGVNNPIIPGDIIMITCPNGSRMQTVTAVNGQTITFNTNDPLQLNQRGAPSGSIMDLVATCGAPQPPNPSNYTALRINMFTYYLNTTARARIPRLMRQYNFPGVNNPARSVAEVIENLQITFDFENGTVNPLLIDIKGDPPTLNALGVSENQIRKVNLFMAGRSDQPYSKTQQYFRNSLETQVSLRSLSFVSQYQ